MKRILIVIGLLQLGFGLNAQESVVARQKFQKDTAKVKQVSAERIMPTITLSEGDLEEGEQSQDLSGLLQSSRDVYTSAAGYTFGALRFKIRGYGSEHTSVLFNQVPMNDVESGRAFWGTWGGLNDAIRNRDIQTGLGYSDYYFGGIGGLTNIDARASQYRKQTKVSYSAANRSYTNRLMFIHSTGLMSNGWAFTLSGSRRWAQEGYVEGTFYDAWSYFVAAEKKINNKHSINFTGFAAPNQRGKGGGSTQEAYDLMGTNYYNPYWGYQNGKKRNSRVSNYHQPMMILTHTWDLSKTSNLISSVSYMFGKGGSTRLERYSGNDPRPDYYRYMPSNYSGSLSQEEYTDMWVNNSNLHQVNWDGMYNFNQQNIFTVNNVNGVEGNNITGIRSNYIVEANMNDISRINLNSVYKNEISEALTVNGGFNVNIYKGNHYKVVDDLLGGEFWLDINRYEETQDPNATEYQNDLNNPNKLIKEGDIFGYNYVANVNKYELFSTVNYSYENLDVYLGGDVSSNTFWRTGKMKNGADPVNSYGDGQKNTFLGYAAKGGATYGVNGRHFIAANASYQSKAPNFRDAYQSVRILDRPISNLNNEKIFTGDLSYIVRMPNVKARLTAYYADFKDQNWVRTVYIDGLGFGDLILKGVDKLSAGIEAGVEVKVMPTLTLSFAGTKSLNIFNSNPILDLYDDVTGNSITHPESELMGKINSGVIPAPILDEGYTIEDLQVAYLKNYRVSAGPQTALTVGAKYNSPKYWFAGINANYYDDMYISESPFAHTGLPYLIDNLDAADYRVAQSLEQEKLPAGYTVDLFVGKSWKVKDYYISLNANVSNVLNNTSFVTGGYEQLRLSADEPGKFGNKYFYLYGTTYFVNLSIRF